jgi:hypothetical protein
MICDLWMVVGIVAVQDIVYNNDTFKKDQVGESYINRKCKCSKPKEIRHLWSFGNNLQKYLGVLCSTTFTCKAAKIFKRVSYMAGHHSQRVNTQFSLTKHKHSTQQTMTSDNTMINRQGHHAQQTRNIHNGATSCIHI